MPLADRAPVPLGTCRREVDHSFVLKQPEPPLLLATVVAVDERLEDRVEPVGDVERTGHSTRSLSRTVAVHAESRDPRGESVQPGNERKDGNEPFPPPATAISGSSEAPGREHQVAHMSCGRNGLGRGIASTSASQPGASRSTPLQAPNQLRP
jgi:hypothetical protein